MTTIHGVGPVVALNYTATIDIPGRFTHSKAVGSVLGRHQRRGRGGAGIEEMMSPAIYG
ncbi:hypothetical protein BN77_p2180024 [Rhizobium mesoamericanum STM3625]|uniref:Transposase n=1 Tax=Rhizobium mesoamericanum STM3625 TaxID=1211777 RepID=K0Q4P7_9HYPH|nr:hypothetical protein BN77_p2180024 [Rhizobium mesoamericanum STM3625]